MHRRLRTLSMTLCPALAVGALIVRPTFAVPYAETAKLTALDAAAGDQFGYSVAISGNIAIVGARGNDDAGSNSGSAYLFVDQVQLPPGVLPEPATAMLGLIGCAALTMRRRRTV